MSGLITERAIGDCFVHLGITVTYLRSNLPPAQIVVLKKASDIEYESGNSLLLGNTAIFEILIKDIERPIAGDIINVDGVMYQVFGEPVRKLELKIWEIDALVM